jgi:protocatechuate 3,4-dioxygenase beta subunit
MRRTIPPRAWQAILPLLFSALPLAAGSVSGKLLDAQGRPLQAARVLWVRYQTDEDVLLAETDGQEAEVVGETRSDAAGSFRIVLEKPGLSVALRIQPLGLPEARLWGPYMSEEATILEDLHFPAPSRFSGKVTDEKGKPVANARLEVRRNGDPGSDTAFLSRARSSADGSWEMPGAPEGGRFLNVRADGFAPFSRFVERKGILETVLRKGGTVRGILLDTAGKPVSGAIVTAGGVAARTGQTGEYRLTGVPAGLDDVETQWKEEFAARRQVKVAAGAEAVADLRLFKAAAIVGTVVDETTKQPVAGVRIAAGAGEASWFEADVFRRRTRSDTRGRFRVGGLAAGRYSVEAARSGYLAGEMPGVVAAVPAGRPLAIALRREAMISGTVVDEQGRPVAGAHVAIPRDFGGGRRMRVMNRASFAPVETDAGPDGAFSLRRLAPSSSLTVQASKAGFAPARRTGIRLKTGEAVRGVSLVLRRGVEGQGTVVDAEGHPVAGADVRAARMEKGRRGFAMILAGAPREKPDAVSDAKGVFRLAGLEAGRYRVTAEKEGLVQKTPVTLDVADDAENRVAPIVLEAGAAVAGIVRNTRGEPIPGADVDVATEGGGPGEVTTDAAGKFRVAGLSAGKSVMIFASANGFGLKQANATPPAEDISIVLDTTGTVRGRVVDADSNSAILDFSLSRSESRASGGQAVMGFYMGDEPRSFHSEDGSFELSGVPAGRWSIRAEAPGYRPAEVSAIEIGAAETKEGVVLSLKRGGTVSGRVLDAARGSAVPNASLSWRTGAPVFGFGGRGQRQTATDADGRFTFDALPEGKITLDASHPDYMEASVEVEPDRQNSVDIALGPGASISGSVVGSDGRTPMGGARVSLDTQGEGGRMGSESTGADGSGAFLFDHLRAGRYQLVAQGGAGTSAAREVVLSDGQQLDGVLLQIARGTLLRGTVSGLPAGRLGGLRVSASGSSYSDVTTTDDEGRFTLVDVPAGVVRVNASTSFPQSRSAQTTVEVAEGVPEMPVEVTFEDGSRLSGQITRAGKPQPGLVVLAVTDPPTGAGRATAQTNDGGHYEIEGLGDGTYEVSVSSIISQGVSYRKVVEVSGDTTGDIELPAAVLSGVVTDASTGMPLEGAEVQSETGEETQSFAVKRTGTDSTGAYSIIDVDPGTYRVTARKSAYRLKTQTATVGTDAATLDFALTKGSGLSIRVGDGQTGIPLAGVQALAIASDGTVAFQGRVSLDAGGAGEVPSLADGRYAIYFFSDGYAPRSLPAVDVPQPAPVSIAMTPGGTVEARGAVAATGRIVDASGATYLLNAYRLDGIATVTPPVTVWQHLAPGSYTFVVTSRGGSAPYPFTVAEGQTTQLRIK